MALVSPSDPPPWPPSPPASPTSSYPGGCECSKENLDLKIGPFSEIFSSSSECSWSDSSRVILYALLMIYFFYAVGLVANIFMEAIEVITSKKKVVLNPRTGAREVSFPRYLHPGHTSFCATTQIQRPPDSSISYLFHLAPTRPCLHPLHARFALESAGLLARRRSAYGIRRSPTSRSWHLGHLRQRYYLP